MKNFVLDNSLKNLGKVVLWQYDKAYRLLSLLKHMQVLFHVSVERFWQYWLEHVLSIEACGEFGCTLWSQLLGVPRPTIVDDAGNKRFISAQVFRRLLKGQFFLFKSTPSIENISNYLEILFGVPGEDAISKWVENVSEYGWTTNAAELNSELRPVQQYRVYKEYEKGDVFQFAPNSDEAVSNWEVTEDISQRENVSWDAIRGKVEQTTKEADHSSGDDLIVLKLYDPNGFCRKMAGASRDSLSIGLTYVFGTTTITATITRSRKSGVVVVDEGDMAMSYAKSEFFDLMLPDQKYLFEQYRDSLLPYPIGIKTNEPMEEVVFGFDGQENEQYAANRAYEKGDVFGYVDETDGTCFNWECQQDVSAGENRSFDSIKGKLKKTSKGDPFIGRLVDVITPYQLLDNYKAVPLYYPGWIYAKGTIEAIEIAKKYFRPIEGLFPDGIKYYVNTVDPWNGRYALETDCTSCHLQYNCLNLGRYKNMLYVYKIPSGEVDNEFITDGKTFAGIRTYFGFAFGETLARNLFD